MDESPQAVRDPNDPRAPWFAAPDFTAVLERSILPLRAHLEDGETARSIKRNKHRHVVYLEAEGQALYVKIHRRLKPSKRLLERFLGDRAQKEWRMTCRLRALGLHTPEPLAHGASTEPPMRSYYLCRAIAPARTLTEVLASPATSRDTRRALLAHVARDLAVMHAAHVHHRDFHGNNVLVHASGIPHIIDLHSPWKVPVLLPSWRRLPLAKFLASLRDELHPNEIDAFLAAYDAARHPALASLRRSAFDRRVRRDAEAIYREHRDSRIQRCLDEATLFTRSRRLGLRQHARKELGPELLTSLVTRAERGEGALLKEAPRTRVARIDHGGRSFVVKTFRFEGVKGIARFVFTRSRAERAWIAARALEVIGIDTPHPHVCHSRVTGPDHIITEFVPDTQTLEDFVPARWNVRPRRVRRAFLERLGRALARLHANDVHHTDLSAKNVLVVERDSELVPWFVDLEAVRLGKALRDEERVRAFGQLNDVPCANVSRGERLRVWRAYQTALRKDADRTLVPRIDAWTRARVTRREVRWRAEGRDVRESAYYEARRAPHE
ncbi:MAG: hypothetical protein H6834_09370 [Planctomycetes bacterium]|nr:hypothetical protein [Planctomycetota bacterium]